jgi:hypothetical protein
MAVKRVSFSPQRPRRSPSVSEGKCDRPKFTVANQYEPTQRALGWYYRLGRPNRHDMKKRLFTIKPSDIKSSDVDLLPWNEDGSCFL